MPSGIEYWNVSAPFPLGFSGKFPEALDGQLPSIEWMTIHFDALFGFLSVVREIWHEPPPWTALPVNESVWLTPIGMILLIPVASYLVSLHGKSAPLSFRGELSGGPNGLGVFMIMCAFVVAKSAAAAKRKVLVEGMVCSVLILPEERLIDALVLMGDV